MSLRDGFGHISLCHSLMSLTLICKFQVCERLKAGGEGDNRGWDGWMASPTQWTWVWARSRRWWRTRKPGMLQSMGSQRIRHDWVTEQQTAQNLDLCLLSFMRLLLYFRIHFPVWGWKVVLGRIPEWPWRLPLCVCVLSRGTVLPDLSLRTAASFILSCRVF